MVYGRYIYTYYGFETNIHITGGHHQLWFIDYSNIWNIMFGA